VAAVLTAAIAVWLLAVSFDLVPGGSAVSGVMASPDQSVAALVQEQRGWALPAAAAASVVAVLVGLALLLAQIPTAPAHTPLRLSDSDGTALATLQPQVLERALVERVQGVSGVKGASVRVSGSTTSLQIWAEVEVADGAQVDWAVDQVRRMLAEDTTTALGSAPRSVNVLVRLHDRRSSTRSDQVAVRQDSANGRLVSATG